MKLLGASLNTELKALKKRTSDFTFSNQKNMNVAVKFDLSEYDTSWIVQDWYDADQAELMRLDKTVFNEDSEEDSEEEEEEERQEKSDDEDDGDHDE
jgi:hypothetical protein